MGLQSCLQRNLRIVGLENRTLSHFSHSWNSCTHFMSPRKYLYTTILSPKRYLCNPPKVSLQKWSCSVPSSPKVSLENWVCRVPIGAQMFHVLQSVAKLSARGFGGFVVWVGMWLFSTLRIRMIAFRVLPNWVREVLVVLLCEQGCGQSRASYLFGYI